jgi:hypothetical protein
MGLLLVASAVFVLAGCSTIHSRINQNPAVFQSLSPTDQAMVRAGQIREGMPKSAVYIAWGRPDHTKSGVRKGNRFETWIYTVIQSHYDPMDYGGYYGYGVYPYGGPWGYWGWGGYPFPFYGGSFYDNWIDTEEPYKRAFFEGDRCTGYEYMR